MVHPNCKNWGVLVFLKFAQFSSELTKTWSSSATECGVWIGNCNVKVWKSTEHKLHNIWRSLKFQQNEHTPAMKHNNLSQNFMNDLPLMSTSAVASLVSWSATVPSSVSTLTSSSATELLPSLPSFSSKTVTRKSRARVVSWRPIANIKILWRRNSTFVFSVSFHLRKETK